MGGGILMACLGYCGRRVRADWKRLDQHRASHNGAQDEVFLQHRNAGGHYAQGGPQSGQDIHCDKASMIF